MFWAAGLVLAVICGTRASRIAVLPCAGNTGRGKEGRGLWTVCHNGSRRWLDGFLGLGYFHRSGCQPTLFGLLGISLVLLVGGIMLLFVKAPPRTSR